MKDNKYTGTQDNRRRMEDRRRWKTTRRWMKPVPRNIFRSAQEDKENGSKRVDHTRRRIDTAEEVLERKRIREIPKIREIKPKVPSEIPQNGHKNNQEGRINMEKKEGHYK